MVNAVDSMPTEILKYGRPGVSNVLTVVYQKIWTSGLDTVADYSLSKKGNTRLCQNNRMIIRISHQRMAILHVILTIRLEGETEQ